MTFPIRRLLPVDAPAYRELMLDAFGRHPESFTSSVTERASLPLAWWQARLAMAPDALEVVNGAFDRAGRLVGAAGLRFESRERTRHKATLFGMYVGADARGGGMGRALTMAALDQARSRPDVGIVQLTVSEGNQAALALYEGCGFRRFGIEPFAVALGGSFVSKVHMWRAVGGLDDRSSAETDRNVI